MRRLPFHVDSSTATAVATLLLALATIALHHWRDTRWAKFIISLAFVPGMDDRAVKQILRAISIIFLLVGVFIAAVAMGVFHPRERTSVIGDMPRDAPSLLQRLNSYDTQLLADYESGALKARWQRQATHTIDERSFPTVKAWVDEHRRALSALGVHVEWDAGQRRYVHAEDTPLPDPLPSE